MKTYLDCIPCLYRQAIEASRKAQLEEKIIKKIIDKTGKILSKKSLKLTPPEVSGIIQKQIQKKAAGSDLYKNIKEHSNQLALNIYDRLKEKVNHSKDSLLTAIELSIAGNIIDFGVKNELNVEYELDKILHEEKKAIHNNDMFAFGYKKFINSLKKSYQIVILADNCGETVFDRVLIEEIHKLYPAIKVIYAVKKEPILNDALYEDAVYCGIDKTAQIISTGSMIPGTVYHKCSKEFLKEYECTDMVISKGQGNFESFVDLTKPVYYLFMAKCSVVANEIGTPIGSINLYFNKNNI